MVEVLVVVWCLSNHPRPIVVVGWIDSKEPTCAMSCSMSQPMNFPLTKWKNQHNNLVLTSTRFCLFPEMLVAIVVVLVLRQLVIVLIWIFLFLCSMC